LKYFPQLLEEFRQEREKALKIRDRKMKLARETNKIISASMLRVRMKSPFFATLALFARVISTEKIATAATDGEDIFINP